MSYRRWQLPIVLAAIGIVFGCAALAQAQSGNLDRQKPALPRLVLGGVYGSDDFTPASYTADEAKSEEGSPFKEEPDRAPRPDDVIKSIPGARIDPLKRYDEAPNCGVASCDDRIQCDEPACDPCRTSERPRLFGMAFGAWLDQGFTANDRGSRDRFNGPITFDDREGEYQMNQLYLFAERKTDTGGCGWDWGGRIDFLYGTDWRFTQALGLETRWNAERFYGAALPQVYADAAWNNLVVRTGHFYSIIGYESVMAPQNYFYSHSYTHQYGEPFTHTGVLLQYKLSDRLSLSGGLDRGWDKWEDNNKQGEFLGGVTLTSCDERTSLAFALSTGPWDDSGSLNRTMYSLVFTHKFNECVKYVIQHDLGVDNDAGISEQLPVGVAPNVPGIPRRDGRWYSIVQYLQYDVSPRWSMGLRFEWFRDGDGTRVGGIGSPHGWELGPNPALNEIGWVGDFYELTAGVHWSPRENILFRPEVRWDWYNGATDAQDRLPYSSGLRRDQFTYALDLIVKF
jgi:hypothetical protein